MFPVTGVSMCVMKGNQHEVKLFEDFWIDKVDMVTFNLLHHQHMIKIIQNFIR